MLPVPDFPQSTCPLARPFSQAEREKIECLFSRQPLLWQLSSQLGLEITGIKQ
jgi:hypothetical protein